MSIMAVMNKVDTKIKWLKRDLHPIIASAMRMQGFETLADISAACGWYRSAAGHLLGGRTEHTKLRSYCSLAEHLGWSIDQLFVIVQSLEDEDLGSFLRSRILRLYGSQGNFRRLTGDSGRVSFIVDGKLDFALVEKYSKLAEVLGLSVRKLCEALLKNEADEKNLPASAANVTVAESVTHNS